jgi:hypothetical protein
MDLKDLAPLQEALNGDSPDFTAEEAALAVETSSLDDLAQKAKAYLQELIASDSTGTYPYRSQRRMFGGANYYRIIFGDHQKVFKTEWLR